MCNHEKIEIEVSHHIIHTQDDTAMACWDSHFIPALEQDVSKVLGGTGLLINLVRL